MPHLILLILVVDASHEGDVAFLIRLCRRTALARHLNTSFLCLLLVCEALELELDVIDLSYGVLFVGPANASTGAPCSDMEGEHGVQLEDGKVVLVEDKEDEICDVLCMMKMRAEFTRKARRGERQRAMSPVRARVKHWVRCEVWLTGPGYSGAMVQPAPQVQDRLLGRPQRCSE
jgi:hypothetical protein